MALGRSFYFNPVFSQVPLPGPAAAARDGESVLRSSTSLDEIQDFFFKENPQFKEKRSIFSSREKVQLVGVSNFAVVT